MNYKKYCIFTAALVLSGGLLSGCSSKSSGNAGSTDNAGQKAGETATEGVQADLSSDPEEVITGYLPENPSKYVKLGTYSGLDIDKNVLEINL